MLLDWSFLLVEAKTQLGFRYASISTEFLAPACVLRSFVSNFEACDWLMRFMQVILLSSHWSVNGTLKPPTALSRVSHRRVTGLSMNKCTLAGINSRKTVPSEVCAPQVSTKH